MKIKDLYTPGRTVFSLEVFPPNKNFPIETVYDAIEGLAAINPAYISVTYGAGGNRANRSTCEIASHIKEKYGIEAMAHLTCINSTRDDVDFMLDDFAANGIENILALRGDNMKIKVDAGASHLVSQLFFDNSCYYDFEKRARAAGIDVPIAAGIMPVTNKKQIERMVTLCGASLPSKFVKMMQKYENDPEALRSAGIAYAIDQIVDLISNDVQGIHLYAMNNPAVASRIYNGIKDLL